jgi:predicted transcriptional regulator
MKNMVFSARVDKVLVAKMNAAVRKSCMTKKQFIEEAIRDKLLKMEATDDVLLASFNAWQRAASPEQIRKQIRSEFNASFGRHHNRGRAGNLTVSGTF